jgi:hypothetical protein
MRTICNGAPLLSVGGQGSGGASTLLVMVVGTIYPGVLRDPRWKVHLHFSFI